MSLVDERLTRLLLETRVIAMVGASVRPDRASFAIGTYMTAQGYRVIPVNPAYTGQTLFGETVVGSPGDIGGPVDMVNIFRRADQIAPVIRDALATLSGLKSVWMQLGLSSAEGRALAEEAGLTVVENRCLLIEHQRLIRRR